MLTYLIIIHILPFLLHTAAQQQPYPTVNCPNIFQYSYDPNFGGYFGLITVERDGSPTVDLQVNMSMTTETPVNDNINIVVLSKQNEIFFGTSVRYAIKFPLQNIFPKLTQIQLNGKILCTGEPDVLEPGVIQTSMWAKSIITTFRGSVIRKSTTPKSNDVVEKPEFFLNFGVPPQSFDTRVNQGVSTSNKEEETQAPKITTSSTTPIVTTTKRTVDRCGLAAVGQNLIIGGDEIESGDFPWLTAIMYRDKWMYKFHCTGNLISDRHVLTAGHCVRYHKAPLFDNEDLIIILGKLNIENWANGGVIRNAKRVIPHPNYKQNTADFDVAIIYLSKSVQFKPTVKPICLWQGSHSLDEITGTEGTLVGWNKQSNNEPMTIAQKIEMPIVSQESCLRSNKVFKKYTSSMTFCAGNRNSVSGPCAGDSGAGFMIKDNSTRTWFLRGIAGFSIRDPKTLTCDLSQYAIFIDIAKIHVWIEDEMKKSL